MSLLSKQGYSIQAYDDPQLPNKLNTPLIYNMKDKLRGTVKMHFQEEYPDKKERVQLLHEKLISINVVNPGDLEVKFW